MEKNNWGMPWTCSKPSTAATRAPSTMPERGQQGTRAVWDICQAEARANNDEAGGDVGASKRELKSDHLAAGRPANMQAREECSDQGDEPPENHGVEGPGDKRLGTKLGPEERPCRCIGSQRAGCKTFFLRLFPTACTAERAVAQGYPTCRNQSNDALPLCPSALSTHSSFR